MRYLCFIAVDFIHSCYHRLKKSNFVLEKNRFRSIDLTCWRSTTAFTILNCLEYEFLKGFLVQGEQQSFWKFSILSNILDLQWCLPNKLKIHSHLSAMFTCRDGKGGKLNSQASKMLYKPPGAVNTASYKELFDQSDCWKLFVQLWNYTKLRYKESCPKCKIPYMHLPQSCQHTSCFKQYTWCILTSILRYKESCHKCIRSWYFLGQPWNILIMIRTL